MADLENNPIAPEEEMKKEEDLQVTTTEQTNTTEMSDSVNVSMVKIIEYGCYGIAILFLIAAIVIYNQDLRCTDGPFEFREHRYVGGDAYNYIISASRSTTVMVKCLIMTVSGFSFALIGRLTALINKK